MVKYSGLAIAPLRARLFPFDSSNASSDWPLPYSTDLAPGDPLPISVPPAVAFAYVRDLIFSGHKEEAKRRLQALIESNTITNAHLLARCHLRMGMIHYSTGEKLDEARTPPPSPHPRPGGLSG